MKYGLFKEKISIYDCPIFRKKLLSYLEHGMMNMDRLS